MYQVDEDEDFPNHEIDPDDDHTSEDNVPIAITFPPNTDNEVIVKIEYSSGTGPDFLYTVASATPSGM